MIAAATHALPAGSRLTAEMTGSLPVYLPDAIFRESLTNQIRMQALNVETITIESAYGLTSRDYHGRVIVTTLAPSNVSSVTAAITTAAERAGSYSPRVTVPSAGQTTQPAVAPSVIEKTIADIIEGVGTAAKGIAEAPDQLFTTSKLIIVGIVVIVALVAIGPNLRGIGSNVRIG